MRAHLPITLERLAQLRARLDAGERLSALLASEGLAEESWHAAQHGWLALIGAESASRRHELAQRYQRAYLEARPGLLASPAREPLAPAADLDGTAMVFTLNPGEALPFVATPQAAPVPVLPEAPAEPAGGPAIAPEDTRTAAARRGATDETAFVPVLSDADALPFGPQRTPAAPPAPAPAAELTLEQYAAFCAERAATPQAPVAERHGVLPGAAAALDQAWALRFEADAELCARFAQLVDQHARWLRRQTPGS